MMIKLFRVEGFYEWLNIACIMSMRAQPDCLLSVTLFGAESDTHYSFSTPKELDKAMDRIVEALS